eukprot:227589-Rhodomonas_salina.1
MPGGFEVSKPDPLPTFPGSIVPRMAQEDIWDLAKLLQTLLPKVKDSIWIPAFRYNKIPGGIKWKEITPSGHRDMRRMAWIQQSVTGWFDRPEILYEALINLASERVVSVQNKDHGLVITREVEKPLIDLDTTSEPPLSRRGSVGSSSSGSSRASVASSTRGAARYAQGPNRNDKGFLPRGLRTAGREGSSHSREMQLPPRAEAGQGAPAAEAAPDQSQE